MRTAFLGLGVMGFPMAGQSEAVFACVDRDDEVRALALGIDGAFTTRRKDSVFVDHPTASASLARELTKFACKSGLVFVDASVSDGEQGANTGQLTVMCVGEETDFARATLANSACAKQRRLMGPAGSGQTTMMINRICLAGLIRAPAEGLNFARTAGLDPEAIVDVISQRGGPVLADGQPAQDHACRSI